MEKRFDEERWLLANSSDCAVNINQDDDEDVEEEEEETLSLVDLPQIQHSKADQVEEKQSISHATIEIQEDFDFCRSFSLKSEMCTADEVFFQGQILPFRHSVSSEKGLLASRSVSRSESMDRYYSNGLFSSRSSSISSSSGSSAANQRRRHPKPPRNQFHSHPSPSPRIHKQGTLNPTNTNCSKKSSMWSIFRLGLVTPPPEIAFQDFKSRFPSNRSNSKNSTNSNSSGSVKNSNPSEKKKKRALFGAGCKCSADAVDTVTSKIVLIKRSEGELRAVKVEDESVIKSPKLTKQQEAKKQMSHRRTFEWLKQLSLEAAREEV